MKSNKPKNTEDCPEIKLDTNLARFSQIIMIIVFAWSGFFWPVMTTLNFYMNMPYYSNWATLFLIGTIFLTASFIFIMLEKYILQMPFTFVGMIFYLTVTAQMINVKDEISGNFKPSIELRYLPMILYCIIALVFFLIAVYNRYTAKKKMIDDYNNSPAKSILDD